MQLPEFVLSREFNAPRDAVWEAWTVPEVMAQWWGPKGFTVSDYKLDFRPGGTYLYGMKAPDGKPMWAKFVYQDIKAPEKLVFFNYFSDANGGVTRHPFSPTWPLELLSTVTFEEVGGKTKVTVRWQPTDKATPEEVKTFADGLDSMTQGWGGTFDQLADFLAKKKAA